MPDQKNPFRIGICMAGAVSAGAYTAGVMDYLLEALSEWEKQRNTAGTPSHVVSIPVIGGASAGGMTALLTATTINNNIVPVDLPAPGDLLKEHPENKLYHSWVDLIGVDMLPKMLDTSDIVNGEVISALNSKFIDDIAKKMICCDNDNRIPTPPYFESPVKLFTTLTNLEGFCYYTGLRSGSRNEKYYMTVHNDYACFETADDGQNLSGPPWMPLNFITGDYVRTAIDAAMATGAFPVGLRPRKLERETKYIHEIPWLKHVFKNTPIETEKKETLNVDGGMINNEPFEKVRDLLDAMTETMPENIGISEADILQLNTDPNQFVNTVLMVDPFPSVPAGQFKMDESIFKVIPKTLGAMLSQMRAKPSEYKVAMTDDGSRFMISPSRKIKNLAGKTEDVFGDRAIACGHLGGFGGFLNKEFRVHDFYLGRYNCEIFLRDYFTVPESALTKNEIFRDGYAGVDVSRFVSNATPVGAEKQYQIIPIFSKRPPKDTLTMPVFSCGENWPRIPEREIDRHNEALKKRIEKIVMTTTNLKGFFRFLLQIGAKVSLNAMLSRKVLITIKDSLYEWSLITGYKPEKK